ncbi:MAG: hypothetical protein CMN93_07725 [Synechococcus sp. CPC35]|nr:hypothetical protein [Synechococcus sp. CPC35]
MAIATAANSVYFRGLTNLVGSLHFWDSDRPIHIFNLGLQTRQISQIETWERVYLQWRTYKDNKPKRYAWKPQVLYFMLRSFPGGFLYLDAGSDVRAPLQPIFDIIQRDGLFLVGGQDVDLSRSCHAGMYDYFGLADKSFRGKPSYSGNTQGYRLTNESVNILNRLRDCANVTSCISPVGSDLSNHRYDQSALSLIVYTHERRIPQHTKYLAAERRQLQHNPKQPSRKIVWTSRQSSREYARYLHKNPPLAPL